MVVTPSISAIFETLARIGGLYAIERDIRGLGASARLAARQARARPILEAMKPWLEAKLAAVSGKSKLAEAIRYMLSRWAGLTRYLDDGRIEIDTNIVERAIRPIAMRKSLCAPSSSICKHWKRVRVDNATRATFTGHRRFHRLRRQVVGSYLMRSAGNNLHGMKDARFDHAPNRYGV